MTVKSCTKAIINQGKEVKSFSLVLLLLFLIVLPSLQSIPKAKANPDWLSGWEYRRSHVINSAANAGTNYQVKIKTLYGFTSFGHTAAETSTFHGTLDNRIRGSVFTTSTGGVVHRIKAYLQLTAGAAYHKVKCAIYKHADSTLVPNSETDEVTVTSEAWTWITFSYSGNKPVLEANTEYVLVAWSEDTDGSVKLGYHTGTTDQGHYVDATYNGFPSSVTFSHTDGEYSIYAEIDPSEDDTVSLLEHCRTDFGDVRFTDDDGITELDYWMEKKVDSDYAVFWVEVADDLSTNDATIYIYYGKSDATTTSNGDNTFLFFDDFPGTSLDTNKWSTSGSGSVSVANSILTVIGGGGVAETVQSLSSFGAYNLRFVSKFKFSHVTSGVYEYFGYRNTDVDNAICASYTGDKRVQNRVNSGTSTITSITSDVLNYRRFEIDWISSSVVFDFDNGAETITHTTGIPDSAMPVWMQTDKDSSDYKVYVDWVFVAKYVDPEPSHGSWGSEEKAGQWHDISTWTFDLSARKWFDVASWDFNISAMQWNDVSVWSFSLAAKAWHDIALWSFNVLTKTWNTIAQRTFQLATRTWHNIIEWSFKLITYGWHTIAYWTWSFTHTPPILLWLAGGIIILILFLIVIWRRR